MQCLSGPAMAGMLGVAVSGSMTLVRRSSENDRLEWGPSVVAKGLSVEENDCRRSVAAPGHRVDCGRDRGSSSAPCSSRCKIQGALAASRAAGAARLAIASGRHREAREPLARWLRAEPGAAERARPARAGRARGRRPGEGNRRAQPGPRARATRRTSSSGFTRSLWRGSAGSPRQSRFCCGCIEPGIKPDPAVDEALARLYLMTYRLRQAEQVIHHWIRDAPSRRSAVPLADGV